MGFCHNAEKWFFIDYPDPGKDSCVRKQYLRRGFAVYPGWLSRWVRINRPRVASLCFGRGDHFVLHTSLSPFIASDTKSLSN